MLFRSPTKYAQLSALSKLAGKDAGFNLSDAKYDPTKAIGFDIGAYQKSVQSAYEQAMQDPKHQEIASSYSQKSKELSSLEADAGRIQQEIKNLTSKRGYSQGDLKRLQSELAGRKNQIANKQSVMQGLKNQQNALLRGSQDTFK